MLGQWSTTVCLGGSLAYSRSILGPRKVIFALRLVKQIMISKTKRGDLWYASLSFPIKLSEGNKRVETNRCKLLEPPPLTFMRIH